MGRRSTEKSMGKRRKNKTAYAVPLIFTASLVMLVLSVAVGFARQGQLEPERPNNTTVQTAEAVPYTGTGYQPLNSKSKKAVNTVSDVTEQRKQEKAAAIDGDSEAGKSESTESALKDQSSQQTKAAEQDSSTQSSTAGKNEAGSKKATAEDQDDTSGSKAPTVQTDLQDGQKSSRSSFSFYVIAKNSDGDNLSAAFLTVNGNGERLYSTEDTGSRIYYHISLKDGENKVSIKATDKNGQSTSVSYTIYRTDSQDTEAAAGTITFSVQASVLGLGYLVAPEKVAFYKGEQLTEVFARAMDASGYTYTNGGTLYNGFYLTGVGKSGITDGFAIPADLMKKLETVGFTQADYHEDVIAEHDFSYDSGWMFSINGKYPVSGMSSYYPNDSDVVKIRFTLYNGEDIGAGNGSWGKEW